MSETERRPDNLMIVTGRAATGKNMLMDALSEKVSTKADKTNDTDDIDMMIVDVKSIDDTCASVTDRKIDLIYLAAADEESRKLMTLSKSGVSEETKKASEERDERERADFDELEDRIIRWREGESDALPENVTSVLAFTNDYQTQTMAEIVAQIVLARRVRRNLRRIVEDCAIGFGDFVTDGCGLIYVEGKDGLRHAMTPEEVADGCLRDPATAGLVCLRWLRHVELGELGELPKYSDDMLIT